MVDTRARPGGRNAISPSLALSRAATVAAPLSARSRRDATSIIIKPATAGNVPSATFGEEAIERKFANVLGRLTFDDEVLDWVRSALLESHSDKRREHEEAIARLQQEYNRLQSRIDTMYVDKLDGRIDAAFFDRTAAQWRDDQARCLSDIERHQNANRSYLDEGVHLLELAQSARRLFERQEAREKRRLLDFVVSNCSWKAGRLTVELRQPFDILAKAAADAAVTEAPKSADMGQSEIWLTFAPPSLSSPPPLPNSIGTL